MNSTMSGLDVFKLILIATVFMIGLFYFGSIWLAVLWAYVGGVVFFRIDSRPAGYLALALLTLTPIALSLKMDELAEALAVNVYYLLCIMVFSEIWSGHKFGWPWFEQILDRLGRRLLKLADKIPNWLWVAGIGLASLVLISGRYFVKSDIPHNSFLDMGGMVVLTDVWRQFSIGWFYQFGRAWNVLTSSWAVLDTELLSWVAGDFYNGIKIHQLVSIVVSAWGAGALFRAINPHQKGKFALISSQVLVGFVYAFNPFFLALLNGVIEFGVAYSLLPWIIWSWLKLISLSKESSRLEIGVRVLVTGVMLSFATVVSGITLVFTNVLPLMVIMAGMGLVHLKSRGELIKRGVLFILVWLGVGLMSLHVLIPTFFGFRQSAGILDESQTEERVAPFVKDFYAPTILELGFLQNKEMIVSEEIGYSLDSVPYENRLVWLLLVVLGLVSILWSNKNMYIVPLWVASGMAGYLALGYSRSWLYRVLNEYFPYFWGLRTPGRFMMIFVLGVSILSALIWYEVVSRKHSRSWRLATLSCFGLLMVVLVISARFQAVKMFTFWTIPSMEYHMEGHQLAKQKLDELNPNMEYRILDLSRDNDGSWNHTRVMAVGQRYFNDFEKYLTNYPEDEWLDILRDYNVKYVVTTSYDDYCDDPEKNLKNTVSCELISQSGMQEVVSTPEGYTIFEVAEVKSYVSGDDVDEDFSYYPEIKTGDEEQTIHIAELYSPQFVWICNEDRVVETAPKRDGLTQSAVLPAQAECKFLYQRPLLVAIADLVFWSLLGGAFVGGIWLGYMRRGKSE